MVARDSWRRNRRRDAGARGAPAHGACKESRHPPVALPRVRGHAARVCAVRYARSLFLNSHTSGTAAAAVPANSRNALM